MTSIPMAHRDRTEKLARQLKPREVYDWLCTKGYFPESYVLPPNFEVSKYRRFSAKPYWDYRTKGKHPKMSEITQVHFPKTELTDRTFGIINPELHSDIAYHVGRNWGAVLDTLFHAENRVCSYSFPIPLDAKHPGSLGKLRSGRMIYEFIEMAENDLASIAYNFETLVKTDIKNFYPSIYTHSIPWALHGKDVIKYRSRGKGQKKSPNKFNLVAFFGNRLDKLFQNANDGCTNGIPIGPAVSDLIAEIVLSAVDREASKNFPKDVEVVRFKDDYRILAKRGNDARAVIKAIQESLSNFNLELNDKKTDSYDLPEGLFRPWVSRYHACNAQPKRFYHFKRFREVYLSVVEIDKAHDGCGVIDRFLADLCRKDNTIRAQLDRKTLPKIMSMLMLLARRRIKSFPKVLAIIEAILHSRFGSQHQEEIATHLGSHLADLAVNERQHRYLLLWIVYFMRANGLDRYMKTHHFKDPVLRATFTSHEPASLKHPDFKLTRGVKQAARGRSLLEHLAVFTPQ